MDGARILAFRDRTLMPLLGRGVWQVPDGPVDQIQFNPFAHREGLARLCARHNVSLETYSPSAPAATWRTRIEENARIFDFAISPEDMAELDALDRTERTDAALERKWWSG